MSTEHRLASPIFINRVEQRSGSEVRVILKENRLVQGKPKTRYLRRILKPLGIKVEVGEWIGSTPFLPLSLSRESAPLTKVEVVRALANDPEIERTSQITG